jgi:hypothetical protein
MTVHQRPGVAALYRLDGNAARAVGWRFTAL